MRNVWKLSSAMVLICMTMNSGSAAAAQKAVKAPGPTTIAALKAQLQEQANRLESLERQGNLAPNALRQAGSAVGLIVGEYVWMDASGHKPLRYQGFDKAGEPLRDQDGNEIVSFEGTGPVVVRDFQATGFLVDSRHLVTSGFLLSPWRSDPLLDESDNPQVVPSVRLLHAYFPGVKTALDLDVAGASESGNIVMCSVSGGDAPMTTVALAESPALEPGRPVVVLGYPGGIQLLMSRIPDDLRRRIYKTGAPSADEAARALAEYGYIQPIALPSRLNGQTEDRVFFETAGNYGTTGGPLIDVFGRAVGMSESIHADFPMFNMGILSATIKPWIERFRSSENYQ